MKFGGLTVLLGALVVSTLATTDVASARELPRGTFQLSGSSSAFFRDTSYEYNGENRGDSDTWNFDLQGLYHVADNIGLGILGYYNHTDLDGYGDYSELLVGPVLQVSFPMNQITNLQLAVTGGYAHQNSDVDDGFNTDYDGYFYGARAGVALFPVDSFSVDLGVSYLDKTVEGPDDYEHEQEDIAGTVGLSVYF